AQSGRHLPGAGLGQRRPRRFGALVQAVTGLGAGIAGLPAILSVGTAALFTFQLALGGLGEAMSAAMTRDQRMFEMSIAGLSRAQQRFARRFRSFILPVRDNTSNAFLSPLDNVTFSPEATRALRSGLEGAARAMGNLAAATLKWLSTSSGVRLIQESFKGVESIFTGLARGVPTLLKGISDATHDLLGGSGLQDTVQRLTENLGEFLSRAALNHSIQRGWELFTNTLKELWSIGKSVAKVMYDITDAMLVASGRFGEKGRGPLGAIADGLKDISKWAGSTGGQTALIDFFRKLEDAGSGVWKLFKELGKSFGYFVEGLVSRPELTEARGGMKGLGDEAKRTQEILKRQADAITGKTTTSLGDSFRRLADLIAKNRKGIVAFGQDIARFFHTLSQGNALENFVKNIASITKGLAEMTPQLAKALNWLVGDSKGKKIPQRDLDLNPFGKEGENEDSLIPWLSKKLTRLIFGDDSNIEKSSFSAAGKNAAKAFITAFGEGLGTGAATAYAAFKKEAGAQFGNAAQDVAQALFGRGGKGGKGGGKGAGGPIAVAFTTMVQDGATGAWDKLKGWFKEIFGTADQEVANAIFGGGGKEGGKGKGGGGGGGAVAVAFTSMVQDGATSAWDKLKGWFKQIFGGTEAEVANAIFGGGGKEGGGQGGGGGGGTVAVAFTTMVQSGATSAWGTIKGWLAQIFGQTEGQIAQAVSKDGGTKVSAAVLDMTGRAQDQFAPTFVSRIQGFFSKTASFIAASISDPNGQIPAAIRAMIPRLGVCDLLATCGGGTRGGAPVRSRGGGGGGGTAVAMAGPTGPVQAAATHYHTGNSGPVTVNVHTRASSPTLVARRVRSTLASLAV
ncbi:hypothetical protein ACWFR0_12595, partial [Streptomyces noursei]